MNTIKQAQVAKVASLLWTGREAAAALHISERTLWALTKEGKMPCIRIGRAVRYDPEDIRAWIERTKTAGPPLESLAE
jgi:excisionase family DNA binding protein